MEYDIPVPPAPPESLPDYLRHFLASARHLTKDEIAVLSKDEATRLWYAHLSGIEDESETDT